MQYKLSANEATIKPIAYETLLQYSFPLFQVLMSPKTLVFRIYCLK